MMKADLEEESPIHKIKPKNIQKEDELINQDEKLEQQGENDNEKQVFDLDDFVSEKHSIIDDDNRILDSEIRNQEIHAVFGKETYLDTQFSPLHDDSNR